MFTGPTRLVMDQSTFNCTIVQSSAHLLSPKAIDGPMIVVVYNCSWPAFPTSQLNPHPPAFRSLRTLCCRPRLRLGGGCSFLSTLLFFCGFDDYRALRLAELCDHRIGEGIPRRRFGRMLF